MKIFTANANYSLLKRMSTRSVVDFFLDYFSQGSILIDFFRYENSLINAFEYDLDMVAIKACQAIITTGAWPIAFYECSITMEAILGEMGITLGYYPNVRITGIYLVNYLWSKILEKSTGETKLNATVDII